MSGKLATIIKGDDFSDTFKIEFTEIESGTLQPELATLLTKGFPCVHLIVYMKTIPYEQLTLKFISSVSIIVTIYVVFYLFIES